MISKFEIYSYNGKVGKFALLQSCSLGHIKEEGKDFYRWSSKGSMDKYKTYDF